MRSTCQFFLAASTIQITVIQNVNTKCADFRNANTFPSFFDLAFCVEMTFEAELAVGVCLNEGPEASLNGTEDHEFSVFHPCL